MLLNRGSLSDYEVRIPSAEPAVTDATMPGWSGVSVGSCPICNILPVVASPDDVLATLLTGRNDFAIS